jgi:chromosome segregation ATPase
MADLDSRIEFLSSSRSDTINSIDRLKKRRVVLMKELVQVEQDLEAQVRKLADLSGTIVATREQRDCTARQAQVLREQEQRIPGLADADRQEIEAVDQLRLDLINALHLLGII